MARPSKTMKLAPLESPEVDGVRVQRHMLELEAARMAGLTRRLGKRLLFSMRAAPKDAVPSEELRETYGLYCKAVLGLLREQRERAKLKPGQGALLIDDETFERELKKLARAAVLEMPHDELAELLRERGDR